MPEKFKFDAHVPRTLKGLPWPVCRHCGLVFLKNRFTTFCIQHGCNHEAHPGYRAHWEQAGKST